MMTYKEMASLFGLWREDYILRNHGEDQETYLVQKAIEVLERLGKLGLKPDFAIEEETYGIQWYSLVVRRVIVLPSNQNQIDAK